MKYTYQIFQKRFCCATQTDICGGVPVGSEDCEHMKSRSD